MTEKPAPTAFSVVDKRNSSEEHVGAAEAAKPPKREITPAEVEAFNAFHHATDRDIATVHEVYAYGLPLWCFVDGKPNCALVTPLRKPAKSAGGVIISTDEKRDTLGTNAIAYLVLNPGVTVEANSDFMPLEPGDVVVVRNAMLEPLDPTLNTLMIHRSHVLAKVNIKAD